MNFKELIELLQAKFAAKNAEIDRLQRDNDSLRKVIEELNKGLDEVSKEMGGLCKH